MATSTSSCFIGALSFEERCTLAPIRFVQSGGNTDSVHLVKLAGDSPQVAENVERFKKVGLTRFPMSDRFSSRSLWDWIWSVVRVAEGDVDVDATCLPREVLGMLLFALSVRRQKLNRIQLLYVSAPPSPGGYATQNQSLKQEEQWLTKGVVTIRSILGFPGNFDSEKRRHLVALAGHEFERLLNIIVFYEPDRLSLSSERKGTSTVDGAGDYSNKVEVELRQELRQKIPLPKIEEVSFSANSITATYSSLEAMQLDSVNENVILAAMNTKLSFVGAALFALHERNMRMVYAVPERYNPLYCQGVGKLQEFDITDLIKSAKTRAMGSI